MAHELAGNAMTSTVAQGDAWRDATPSIQWSRVPILIHLRPVLLLWKLLLALPQSQQQIKGWCFKRKRAQRSARESQCHGLPDFD